MLECKALHPVPPPPVLGVREWGREVGRLADIARHVIGCQISRNEMDDESSNICQAFHKRVDDVASSVCQALARGGADGAERAARVLLQRQPVRQ